ncbi:hypothetical protein [Hoeflea sp.]
MAFVPEGGAGNTRNRMSGAAPMRRLDRRASARHTGRAGTWN